MWWNNIGHQDTDRLKKSGTLGISSGDVSYQ